MSSGDTRKIPTMRKIKRALLPLIFVALVGQAPWLKAGDVVGTVAVAKPDQMCSQW